MDEPHPFNFYWESYIVSCAPTAFLNQPLILLPPHLLPPMYPSPGLPVSVHHLFIHFHKLCWAQKEGPAGSDLKAEQPEFRCSFATLALGQVMQPLWAFNSSSIYQDKVIPRRDYNNDQVHVKVLQAMYTHGLLMSAYHVTSTVKDRKINTTLSLPSKSLQSSGGKRQKCIPVENESLGGGSWDWGPAEVKSSSSFWL